jgi:assimilatory nitrate reductase catalytic subunit
MPETRSTCCYCGVGCGVLIEHAKGRITGVRGDPEHPANFGRLCSKGSRLAETASAAQDVLRATQPMLRTTRTARRVASDWSTTLDHLADRFAAIIAEHGPDAVAFYLSGQLLTEDYYVFNKIAKGLIGTNNVDTNSRLCMSSAVSGYKQTLGVDAPPCSYEDIDSAVTVFIAGSNTAYAHPILYRRLEAARAANPELRVIVVDPRRTDTAREADLHLAILPGTDVALFNAMLHVMLWEGLVDQGYIDRHTEGFATLKATVREYAPETVATTCGVAAADIVQAARWFAQSPATLSMYCQGLNQSSSGTAKNAALINLHLATGQIGKPGAGPFSLTGQPNAMGGREVGGLATTGSAHRELSNAADRNEMARFWGVDQLPAAPGKTAVEMFEAIRAGTIKAVWIACTNPAQSLPDQTLVHAALAAAELVVVQDAYLNTETTAFADAILPAASWGEKEGTVTNSERRITRLFKAIDPPGAARADWAIGVDFARKLEARLHPERPTLFPYDDAESVWNEHRETTRGRDLDITGLSYELLDARGPQQWPIASGATTGTARLYTDGRFPTPSGRARFVDTKYRAVSEPIDARHPFHLLTGRLRDQWHSMTRSGTVAGSFGHAPEPLLSIAASDFARLGFADDDLVRVKSRRGETILRAEASDTLRAGQVFMPMHWGARYLSGTDTLGINTITNRALDPFSKQPELKHAAVRVEPAALPWRLIAVGTSRLHSPHVIAEKLREHMRTFAFASVTLVGDKTCSIQLRAAGRGAPDAAQLAAIDTLLELDGTNVIRYDDARRAIGRRIAITDTRLCAFRLAGPIESCVAGEWMRDVLVRGEDITPIRRALAAPSATPPHGTIITAKTVCSCFGVDARRIETAIDETNGPPAVRLAQLQVRLQCGTNCGSCVPELKAMIAAHSAPTTAPAPIAA